MIAIAYLLLSVFPAALIIAAANDIYEFKIPNWISIVLVAVYPLAGFAVGASYHVMVEGALIGAAALTIGFGLFAAKIVGGGDAKPLLLPSKELIQETLSYAKELERIV